MTSRWTLVLPVVAALVAGCSARGGYRSHSSSASSSYTVAPSPWSAEQQAAVDAAASASFKGRGEEILEQLPWKPDVYRMSLASRGPVALAQIYVMADDLLAVDSTGKVFCLSRRDLTPRWVSSLRAPLAAPIAESPLHFVCLERDSAGASWLEWFSKRSGAAADGSPARLPYSASSGVSATAGTAFIGSYGSPLDNKTMESVNLADGTPSWGFRTFGRIVATPTVDPSGEIVLVACEDKTFTSLPTKQGGASATTNWVSTTLGANTCVPAVTKDWAFLGSDDNFVRCFDLHSGSVVWLKGLDAPVRKTPWLLGSTVTKSVLTAGEGSPKTNVESYEGFVFAKNPTGLHCFVAGTGDEVFTDTSAERPLVKMGEWVITLGDSNTAQFRKGKGLPVVKTESLEMFDFLPTNSSDGQVIAGFADGTILLAVPK